MPSYKRQRKILVRRIEDVARLGMHNSDERRIVHLRQELLVFDSDRLRERANRFGIDLIAMVGPWETDSLHMWLKDKEQIKARRVIAEARFEWWKKWIGLLSPVISIIISLLAVAFAALALYLQLTGKLPAK